MSNLVSGGIQYLDNRTEFWRQQKPIYAREQEQKMRTTKKPITKYKNDPWSVCEYVK